MVILSVEFNQSLHNTLVRLFLRPGACEVSLRVFLQFNSRSIANAVYLALVALHAGLDFTCDFI